MGMVAVAGHADETLAVAEIEGNVNVRDDFIIEPSAGVIGRVRAEKVTIAGSSPSA
jgi:cytoskeletal protein CcmA (bactofilin family)